MSGSDQEETFEKILVANLQRVLDFLKYAEAKNGALLTFASAWILAIVGLISNGRTLPLGLDDVVPYGITALSFAGVCAISSFFPQVDPFRFLKDKHVINKNFAYNEVSFGIGLDYGQMLATKTGVRRHGDAQQSYRSLVWLGRPANIASKLTDQANKPEESTDLTVLNVTYDYGFGPTVVEEYPHSFVLSFTFDPLSGSMRHASPAFRSYAPFTRRYIQRAGTPPILMSKRVCDGFKAARPEAIEFQQNWIKPIPIKMPDYDQQIFGTDVVYRVFQE